MNTYLGQKGYTIPKSELSIETQVKIRSDLMIKENPIKPKNN